MLFLPLVPKTVTSRNLLPCVSFLFSHPTVFVSLIKYSPSLYLLPYPYPFIISRYSEKEKLSWLCFPQLELDVIPSFAEERISCDLQRFPLSGCPTHHWLLWLWGIYGAQTMLSAQTFATEVGPETSSLLHIMMVLLRSLCLIFIYFFHYFNCILAGAAQPTKI